MVPGHLIYVLTYLLRHEYLQAGNCNHDCEVNQSYATYAEEFKKSPVGESHSHSHSDTDTVTASPVSQ